MTDANLVLGRLDEHDFLGGGMKLDAAAARKAVSQLAASLGLGLEETAEGILTIINNNMANAIRSRTVQKGIDPRGFALVAFGGAGPLHGADVAALLEIPEVIVPPYPGITSAIGLLTTDLKYDAIRTQFQVEHARRPRPPQHGPPRDGKRAFPTIRGGSHLPRPRSRSSAAAIYATSARATS